ncbi:MULTISPECIES: DEAD/DEAH box helicase [Streptomyces]|uniref:DEAD/DEAH box helicase n=1 Tax=Streptomyces TaxID=1883 RepID=UPI001C2E6145|nr:MULTISPECIES: DEAD/DEAH box helicase [Streptomyces]MBV1944960.1 DEAD/DEAH box helicase [Streptomyces sp. BV129]BDH05097.1 DEAD-box ATP-dependent RNA helicase CshA [Streptomyces seoulensis]
MTTNSSDGQVGFADLDLAPEIQRALTALGYEEPTPIQQEAIPPLLEGNDLLGQAATGTGKTAAFALPVIQRIAREGKGKGPSALVLVPTRELAIQVSEAVHRYGTDLGVRVLPVYGGQPIGRQLRELQRGVDVVVATPGRALDHIARGTLRLDDLRTVVLDEADEMLDMGFSEDIDSILENVPDERQTVLFSATMPSRIDSMARKHLNDPVRVRIEREAPAPGEAPRVRESAYIVGRAQKAAALGRLLDVESPEAAIVFCRTRDQVDQLSETLNGRGYRAEALHGGLSQEQRDRVMGRLRGGTADLLVATDVAARGIDVEHLTHVINYDVPSAPESYVHRIGRVGRAGREGVAITLAEPRESRMLKAIERATGRKVPLEKVPSVADLRARRLELTRAALQESLLQDEDLDRFRVVVETLGDEFDVMDVALAAVKLAHESGGAAFDEEEIPELAPRDRDRDRGDRGRDRDRGPRARRPQRTSPGMTRLFVGAGRSSGVRPQDLVGAIAGETRLSGRDIGAIEIADRFSLVEVPEEAADDVVRAMRGANVKGRKAPVRRERDQAR